MLWQLYADYKEYHTEKASRVQSRAQISANDYTISQTHTHINLTYHPSASSAAPVETGFKNQLLSPRLVAPLQSIVLKIVFPTSVFAP